MSAADSEWVLFS